MFHKDHSGKKSFKLTVLAASLSSVLALAPVVTAYANDFEIYQKPTGGKKTLIMMLDTSGSMDNTDGGSDSRLTRLIAGMNAVLDSSDPKLTDVVMGVGNFSANGDGKSGQILVPAKTLGAVGSTQRNNLKAAISGLTANSYTPSAHAYAEAASYLMGTTTYSAVANVDISVDQYRVVGSYTTTTNGKSGNKKITYFNYTYKKYTCVTLGTTNWTANTQSCSNWGSATTTTYNDPTGIPGGSPTPQWTNAPTISPTLYTDTDVSGNNPQTILYFLTQSQAHVTVNPDSGIVKSKGNDATYSGIVTDRTVADVNLTYKSPLPASTDRASCDGQGIYFLTDGVPNNTGDAEATVVMKRALQGSSASTSSSDYSAGFTCTGGLSNTTSNSGWACMSKFAKALYGPPSTDGSVNTNPSLVSIKTAFVGFGGAFNSLSSSDVVNACRISSRLTGDTCSPDATSTTYRNPAGGYGNGGFYIANTADDVTYSVTNFISNLGSNIVNPLVTGAATVPVDDLNPNGFQAYGYLRMLEPNPANKGVLLWRGNVKKYKIAGGKLQDVNNANVLNTDGSLVTGTTDLWNASSGDGGNIALGGAYAKVKLPSAATPNTIRPLFTDVGSVTQSTTSAPDTLVSVANGAALTSVTGTITTAATDIPTRFSTVAPMKDMDTVLQKELINYLGYGLALDATAIPSTLPTPANPNSYLSMGGSDHAQPIQLSYSATITPSTGAITARTESVLYGSMEGGLHLVDATTGVEQMVFVPGELLSDSIKASTLSKGSLDTSATPATPNQGVDGPWVADAAYKTNRTSNKLTANRMNVYGGLRMGGSSYYGLDLMTPTAPKLIFRVGPDKTGYSRMGQSWSKPVLANIRYGNKIKRVMIVGGGYDPQYEVPSYVPTTLAPALGNTVYMISVDSDDAGTLIWSASKTNMIHSIVSRISTLDRDADGLVDSIYFGDLGGQVYRADFNNAYGTSTSNFGVRVTRLANLATDSSGAALTNGKGPRFYEAPTVTIHDQGSTTFGLISLVSGNRSSPLDVMGTSIGGGGLTGLPTNKVFAIIDSDIARTDFIKLNSGGTAYVNTNGSTFSVNTQNLTQANLQADPQTLTTTVASTFTAGGGAKAGWYRSLSSVTSSTGVVTEKADGTIRKPGGMKAFEEPIAITNKLYVTVYDPEGKGVPASDPCLPRVVGETDYQTYCLPYGVCLGSDGKRDTTTVVNGQNIISQSGFQYTGTGNTSDTLVNAQAIGAGIRGLVLGDNGGTATSCRNFTIIGNTGGTGNWSCTRKLVQTLWYEKKPNPALVN